VDPVRNLEEEVGPTVDLLLHPRFCVLQVHPGKGRPLPGRAWISS
jgi:hypothetical protein